MAKLAAKRVKTYFVGSPIHNVLVLASPLKLACSAIKFDKRHIHRPNLRPYIRYMSCNGSGETALMQNVQI